MKDENFKKSLNRSLNYITNIGLEKLSLAKDFKDITMTEPIREVNITFQVLVVLHSVGLVKKEFLNDQQSEWVNILIEYINTQYKDFSFNYRAQDSKLKDIYKLPDDLDDTAGGMAALLINKSDIPIEFFLKIINLETAEGGPYHTWYVKQDIKDSRWLDIDPIVNANLVYATALDEVRLNNTEEYLYDVLKKNKLKSPYYIYDIVGLLYLSRFVKITGNKKFSKLIKEKLNDYKYSQLSLIEQIIYNIVLINLKLDIDKKKIKDIVKKQNHDGSLPVSGLWYSYPEIKNNESSFTGSRIISTSLFIELLASYLSSQEVVEDYFIPTKIQEDIGQLVFLRIMQSPFKEKLEDFLDINNFFKAVKAPILLALQLKPRLSKLDRKNFVYLSCALYFGWLSFTFLDEILDKQKELKYVPLSIYLNNVYWEFLNKIEIKNHDKFIAAMREATNTSYSNYLWESESLHYNSDEELQEALKRNLDYTYIADRMKPYIVALSLVPQILNTQLDKEKTILEVMKSIVIIDQLNDDAHDWKDDEKNKILSYVTYTLFKDNKDESRHENIFWEVSMEKIIKLCLKEHQKAKKLLEKQDFNFLSDLLERSIRPILHANIEIKKTKSLIQNF